MEFYTKKDKPNLYILVGWTAIVLLVAFFLFLINSIYGLLPLFITYFAVALIILINAFFGQIRYNPYSYNTIIYSGFSLYFLFILITLILILVQSRFSGVIYNIYELIGLYLSISKIFMYLSLPFMLVFCTAICISNIVLISKEGKSIYNTLGIVLSILMIGGNLFLFSYDYYFSGNEFQAFMHDLFVYIYAGLYIYFECMMIGTIIANAIVNRHYPRFNMDYLIVLGCGLLPDGSLTPLLKGRVDNALEFYHKQKNVNDKKIMFVTSGGQGPDEVISEAEAMKNYLISQGIDEDLIIVENESTNTLENMKFSKQKINYQDKTKVAFSTTNYHVFRSGIFANMAGMKAEGFAAKTKWYFWPNAAVREFVGLLTRHKFKQAFVILTILLIHVILMTINFMH